jgi:hypothetical protein
LILVLLIVSPLVAKRGDFGEQLNFIEKPRSHSKSEDKRAESQDCSNPFSHFAVRWKHAKTRAAKNTAASEVERVTETGTVGGEPTGSVIKARM